VHPVHICSQLDWLQMAEMAMGFTQHHKKLDDTISTVHHNTMPYLIAFQLDSLKTL